MTGEVIVKRAGFSLAFPLLSFWLIVLLSGPAALGQAILADRDGRSSPQTLALPYAFYNEYFGFAGAYVYGLVGKPQPQSSLLGTAMAGTAGSGMIALVGRDVQMPGADRMFFDPVASVGFFSDTRSFINGNSNFPNARAGTNSSNPNNYIEGDGWDNYFRLRFKYVMPIGLGKTDIVTTYRLERGLLVEPRPPASHWNPLVSGKTYLELRPFYRNQQIDGDDGDEKSVTNGVDLNLYWDNRDFFVNPSTGHSLKLGLSRDFGLFDSSNSWTFLQAEFDQYFSLGETDWFRQRVLAFDVWTGNSPTWQVEPGDRIDNRPPAYAGATLGGLWRMRAYPSQRFSDKAGIYYAAELRLIPDWNPFPNWPLIQKYVGVEWLQVVPFVELGRVAPDWELENLHSSMKWDVGLGLRAWAKGLVVRLDTAASDESVAVQMMVSQPFQW